MASRKPLSVFSAISNAVIRQQTALQSVDSNRGWFTIRDWTPGAWQADAAPLSDEKLLANWAVYSCISLIAGDISKLCLELTEYDEEARIWTPTRSAAFGPVLRKVNHFQTMQQFIESWMLSKLVYGNTYVLKVHDRRGLVTALYVLDPTRVYPLRADNGMIFYRLGQDPLSGITEELPAVPAIDIIHDRMMCLFHPLVGIPPLYASSLAASQGYSIQRNSEKFFKNMSRPSGVLVAPGEISDTTAERLKEHWEANYGGDKLGKVAVLGNGLKYEAMNVNPVDAQLTEQLSLSAKTICSTYHVPPFKIGLSDLPAGQKVEDMNQIYYADCLQVHIEAIEKLIDRGLYLDESPRPLRSMFDLEDLMRMDNSTMMRMLTDGVKGNVLAPNEARRKKNLPPLTGGDSVYMQQQNYSLEALSKRDGREDPFAKSGQQRRGQPPDPSTADSSMQQAAALIERIRKGLE